MLSFTRFEQNAKIANFKENFEIFDENLYRKSRCPQFILNISGILPLLRKYIPLKDNVLSKTFFPIYGGERSGFIPSRRYCKLLQM